MKVILTLCFLSSFVAQVFGQQEQVLAGADTSGQVTVIQKDEVQRISDYQLQLNKLTPGTTSGYRIEIFFGKNKEDAKKIMKQFSENRDSISCNLEFDHPYLRVRVGNFRSRLEAQKLYYELKDEFDTVIIVKVNKMAYPPIE